MTSTITNHKQVTYFIANNGNAPVFEEIHKAVNMAYPVMPYMDRMARVYALYHSSRCCHYQGYLRFDIRAHKKGQIPTVKLVEAVRRYVNAYNQSTIDCWLPLVDPTINTNVYESIAKARVHWLAYQDRRRANTVKATGYKLRVQQVGHRQANKEYLTDLRKGA